MTKEFITGNEAVVKAALMAGSEMMTGYPITPTTEILEHWADEVVKNPKLKILQTEDEMSAGFAMIGGVLAGQKAFTATAGPGHVLMQDALAMAENMRLPVVVIVNQRGGPSTGTIIYSQQEVTLSCFGGNGEGLRIVYSAGSPQELYDFTLKAFNAAWKYRFPTIVLGDGYSAKTQTEIEIYSPEEKNLEMVDSVAYLLNSQKEIGHFANLRNTYNFESELNELLTKHKMAFEGVRAEIVEYEDYHTLDAKLVIFAHGIVGVAAKKAVDILRQNDKKVGLFRPITLNPFPAEVANSIMSHKECILVAESSLGQFEKIVKDNLYGITTPIISFNRAAMGITPEEIVDKANSILEELNG